MWIYLSESNYGFHVRLWPRTVHTAAVDDRPPEQTTAHTTTLFLLFVFVCVRLLLNNHPAMSLPEHAHNTKLNPCRLSIVVACRVVVLLYICSPILWRKSSNTCTTTMAAAAADDDVTLTHSHAKMKTPKTFLRHKSLSKQIKNHGKVDATMA